MKSDLALADLTLAERRKLLRMARARDLVRGSELPPIEPVARDGRVPLSFAQQRLWFVEQLGELGSTYHLGRPLRLRGELDREALVRALDRVVARHEALRTTFAQTDGVPEQRIAPADTGFALLEHDLRGRADANGELERLMAEEARAPFDLARGPLIRGRLVRLAAEDHVLLVTMHHIVSDAWSMGVLTHELGALYAAFHEGREADLPVLTVQYADYAVWQRGWVESDDVREQADYWTRTLAGAPELLELPADHPRPPRQDFAGDSVALELDAELTAALTALSRRHGTTLFMTVLAGWAAVLGRLSGQDDVVIGTPTANRGRREIEGLIGFFVNTLAVRVDLSGSPTVAELLGRVKERALGAQAHQDIPFEQVVERVSPARSLAHTPLFQALFAWQNASQGGLGLPGLEVGGVDRAPSQAREKFDLTLSLEEAGEGIAGSLSYATALFDRATMERWAGYLRRVLEEMAADERRPVERLALMPAGERARVLVEWNQTDAAYPDHSCVHELFEAQVERTPDATALVFAAEHVTFAELNRRANRLAHHLRSLGVGPDVRVALCVDRSPEMVVGLLGVLKAGGAYVPLDPGYPAERLRWMLADSAPAAVLTQAHLRDRVADAGVPVVELDDALAWADRPEANPAPGGLRPEHLAYVIYTSGSTGRPKGVEVPHRGVVNRLAWMEAVHGLGPGEVVLQKTPYGFDVSVWEFFWPLAAGARLVLARPEGHRDPEYLLDIAGREGITTLHFVPSLLAALLEHPGAGRGAVPALRRVVSSGEALPPELVARFGERLPGVELHNLYGPTEASVDVTAWRCATDGAPARVPIGRPVPNTRIYLLDGAGEPVPVGVAGELCIDGVQVARGYQGRPGLTAERFVADAFGGEPGARLYRTGDLARWRPDGTLEHLGRTDFQVKVRGFRIELGEIEARLAGHPAVHEAVVVARDGAAGDRRLVAYYVATGGPVEVESLRGHLGERLPDYMVPSAFVRLDALPLTPNGKLDRKALPAPEGDAFARRGYEAPVGETEGSLAEVWQEVLGTPRVGRRDHFFELGGHSLLAVRVISRVRQVLGVETELGDVFTRPVLADFAHGLETAARAELPPVEPAPREGRIPLSFAQQRLWFLEQLGNLGSAYHIPRRLRLRGPLDRAALLRALEAIVARHEALRTVFAENDGVPEQRIAPADVGFHLVEHDLEGVGDAEAELDRWVAEEMGAPFDLARGPLIRGRLLHMGHDDHVLLLTMHHIVSDAWSGEVFFAELAALYAAHREGREVHLPALPVQYADYAVWQRRWVEGEVLERQAAYWTDTLAGAPELLELPADRPRPALQDHAGGVVALELDDALTAALKTLSRRHGTTLFMTLLAGWAAVLSRLSGQAEVVIGTPSANRGRREIEGLIGFFVNTLPLRLDLGGSPAAGELLGRVKERALGAQAHQDIPFEQVVERVDPVRSLSHGPLFQVMFVWQNAPRGHGPSLPGLEVEGVGMGSTEVQAKFDLLLDLAERDGRIAGSVSYAAALFDRSTVERHLVYLRRVLEGMAADDGRGVDHLPMLSEDERVRVLREWNATAAAYPRQACVHELFEAQAARTPGATALVFEGERLAYAELNARANRLAHHLRALGVGPDARVAICAERGVEMVVGLLAILKAGGAYLPLDAGYPVDRLRYMLDDSAPAVLLTHPPLAATAAALAAGSAVPVIDVADGAAWAHESTGNPPRGALGPGNLGYVMYTSGSTGRPKGVMLDHGSLVNRLAWMQDRYRMEPGEALLQKTPFSFDVSFWEFFWPLMVGARLVMARPGGHRDPAYLVDTIRREGITTVHFVPSMLQLFLEHPGAASCDGLRRVPVSGEAISAALVRHFHERLPGVGLYNQYGPTESGEVTEWACEAGPARAAVSIGRPIHNSTVYLLDGAGEPVPVGVAGELFIGGTAVARGYLGRPALTAERFVPDPFGPAGARLYRTGDLGRRLGDGALEFLGRTDFQVKVRGFRIELGEIEARLAAHPGVREAVVLALDDGAGGNRLAAYYVGDAPLDAEALRAHVSEQLPEYMVPAALVWMPAFPVTANGKLDRRALPLPGGDAFVTSRGYEAPAGETETALAEVWSHLLGAERVGRWDDFFELGGHSLLVVQLVSRVRQVLGVEVPVGAVFERPLLAELARVVAQASRAELPPIEAVERGGGVPLSFAQQRLWFLEQLEALGSTYHIHHRLRLRGVLDRAALARALDGVVARHEALRTVFAEVDGVPRQRIAPPDAGFHLAEHDLDGEADAEAVLDRLVVEEGRARFDLERGPLIRGRLVRMAADDHVLLVTMHHIVGDGWSSGVFLGELGALYAAHREGREAHLPALPVQYADYAVWQRRWVEGEVLERQAAYWAGALAGAPELLELPTDRPRPSQMDHAGDVVGLELDEALTAALKALSRRHGTTLFMTLLAGWAAVLGRLAGRDDVVIGTPTANRRFAEIEGLIGFFVNTLALRVDLSGRPTVAELLGRVQRQVLDAQHNQDIPFEHVVERVAPDRNLAHSPVFDVMLSWQHAAGGPPALPGLEVRGLGGGSRGTAKFALFLSLSERDGRIEGGLEYATALFDRDTVERWLAHLRSMLRALAEADGGRRVEELEILSPAERARVVDEWNATDAPYPGACLHQLFEARAERTPGATALVFEGERLTYAELNRRANRLARYLIGRGVGPDVRVALCVERGPRMLVGLLGVLKAGGAYVPLDPAHPEARLRHIVADSGPAVLLTEQALRDRASLDGLFQELPVPVVALDADEAAWEALPDANPGRRGVTPLHLAYVIYTSGSTGTPKGVMNAHGAVVNLLASIGRTVQAGAGDRLLAVTTLGFDISVLELFLPLVSGAEVHLLASEENADPALLARAIDASRATLMQATPATWRLLVDSGWSGRGDLRALCGGEALPTRLAAQLLDRVDSVWNVYGPTETTIWSSAEAVSAASLGEGGQVSIGGPLANTRFYVLDGAGLPVPVGVVGELYIGGAGLARGYHARPGLTAGRFVPDPFGGAAGARLYRTGDLGRRRADGRLEFLGRNDFQVKVRGYRIELGEIEARLREHPAVREAVVQARASAGGEARLVGYVAADWSRAEEVAEGDGGARGSLEAEHAGQWMSAWEHAYGEAPPAGFDRAFDISGWNSSYTGKPIPAEEMREWVDATVARIRSLAPRRVLEIGCGTGLLLARVAPGCEQYVGLDFSARALRNVEALKRERPELRHVEVLQRAADELDGFAEGSFDTVVINSVAQYLPSLGYLRRVLERAARVVAPGGHVFVGDVRDLRLLGAFHTAVETHRSAPGRAVDEWREQAEQAQLHEAELVIDPRFFLALAGEVDRVDGVETLHKRGRFHNELTQFRYDVVLHVGSGEIGDEGVSAGLDGSGEAGDEGVSVDGSSEGVDYGASAGQGGARYLSWEAERLSPDALDRLDGLLGEAGDAAVVLLDVPNARVGAALGQLELRRSGRELRTVDEVRRHAAAEGVDPEALWRRGEALGWSVEVRLAASGDAGRMDVRFAPRAGGGARLAFPAPPPARRDEIDSYATDPLRGRRTRALVAALRGHLGTRLPAYMVPAAYVLLDRLPLTPNGKLDRKALPAPEGDAYAARAYEAPVGEAEAALAEIWAEVLGGGRVGRGDDFFELGGHSLLAVQVVSRVRQLLGVEVALGELFSRPVLRDFAQGLATATRTELPPVEPAPRDGRIPLSFAQRRLWFLEQLGNLGSTYHLPQRLRLRGELHRAAFIRALDAIVARHEALRTVFAEADGVPEQRIAPAEGSRFHLVEHDLAAESEADAGEALERLMAEEARAPFDLERGPLIRGRLVRMAADDHVLLLTMHHIVSDGWSGGVLTHELSALYAAFREGSEAALPALPVQYADYAVWQRRWVEGEVLQEQSDYWLRTLAGAPELLELPADHPRPAEVDHAGSRFPVDLGEELTAALNALGRRHATTLFMTVLAGWAAVLGRLSGQAQVVIGTPTANRGRREIEGLIGFFVNTLALRVDLSGSPTVVELLRRVKERSVEAQDHQDIPFEQVVERIDPARSLAHHPLFQVMFSWQNASLGAAGLSFPGLEVGGVGTASSHAMAKFDLSLDVAERDGRIQGNLTYATALFERATVERYVGYLRRVLEEMAADESQRVERLALMPADERARVLDEWNRTDADFPRDLCVHQLFEGRVERAPDATALVFAGESLSYAELNARANRLAHHLRSLGVGPDVRVGICAERSLEMVVGLLGVLKAGGAYVPLDPGYPPERLRYMVENSAPVVVLTQAELRDRVDGLGVATIALDADALAWASQPTTNPERGALTPDNLTHLIYTSGSTGRPKGVMMEHRGGVNRFVWMQRLHQLGVNDDGAMLQNSSFSFDASVWELLWPLSSGARVVLSPPQAHQDLDGLVETIRREGVRAAFFVPSMLQLLLENGGVEDSGLRRVMCGGEALPPALARRLEEVLPGVVLFNMFGPSEASQAVMGRVHVREGDTTVPLGRPNPNTRVYILDASGAPVPAGVVGELYIGGVQMARGYQARPALTADRFLPDPFGREPGGRLYRTGDLGRWRADGRIEYLGRGDLQVKVRGFRIELGEIEARLLEHPGVREAVVLAREDAPGEKRLVAYAVGDEEAVTAEVLRAHLGETLPSYMVPAAYVRMDEFPLSPNGKLDRAALPAPEGDAYARRGYEAPVGEAEAALAEIWAELLGLERVGRWDNFFELGGHSLLAVQVISRLRRRGLHTEVRALFTAPTLSAMAAEVGGESREVEVPANRIPAGCGRVTPEMLPLVDLAQEEIDRVAAGVEGGAANVQDIYPLAPLQEGILFHHLMTREGDPYLLAFLSSFDSREALDRHLDALRAVIARNDILRTSVMWEGLREAVQVVWRRAPLVVEEVELEAGEGDAAERLYARFDPRHHRMDVREAPLMRAHVAHDPAGGRWLLLLLRHHLIGDHTTQEGVQAEIDAHLAGRGDALPAPMPFRNHIARTRLGLGRAEHEAFFCDLLGDVDEPTAPFGLLDVRGSGTGIAEARLEVDARLSARLRERARMLGVSAATLCHVAWAQVLARVSGRDDVVFGTVLLGRMQGGEGADRTMGPFINTLPIRVRLGEVGVEATVRETHAVLAKLLRHEHASLALAQRASGVEAPAPLFTSLLNYRHSAASVRAAAVAAAAGDGMSRILGEERSNYPLTLSVDDLGEGFWLRAKVKPEVEPRRVCALMHTALQGLVDALETAPERAVGRIDVLPASERARVLDEWNRTDAAYPAVSAIPELFEAQVERTPDATAVVFAGAHVSYAELNRRANRLAHHLRALGVGPDVRVGICVERSLEMMVGLLALLKAGGAYVPLDPGYPAERLAYMLEDSAPAAVLTQSHLRDRVDVAGVPVIELDDPSAWASEVDINPMRDGLTPDHLAYVMYTSGSTGRPKGVAVRQRNVVNRLSWMQRDWGLAPGDAILQSTTLSFDVSVYEVLWPISMGGRVVLARADGHMDPGYLVDAIQTERINIVNFVPSMLQLFLEHPQVERCTYLHRAPCGGEALSPTLARRFRERLPWVSLHNRYGPTEAAASVTLRVGDEVRGGSPVPIGRPVANTRVYVLDARGEPVPVGVAGELYIGGVGVGRGYLDRPEQTAERFVADPFSAEPGARLYRTGDLARWLADGTVEFLGRTDFQAKVRGFRIEPGEVEARLVEHAAVREAVVLIREDAPGDKRLVAYYVGVNGGVEVESLRTHLGERLPDYMVPAAYVRLERLPLTPNGKLDRGALPAPEGDAYASEAYEAPVGETEAVLAGIWAEVLGLERVGRRDDFFRLGGHSLLAVRVVSRVRELLEVDVALGELFTRPVLSDFAQEIVDAQLAQFDPGEMAELAALLRDSTAG